MCRFMFHKQNVYQPSNLRALWSTQNEKRTTLDKSKFIFALKLDKKSLTEWVISLHAALMYKTCFDWILAGWLAHTHTV